MKNIKSNRSALDKIKKQNKNKDYNFKKSCNFKNNYARNTNLILNEDNSSYSSNHKYNPSQKNIDNLKKKFVNKNKEIVTNKQLNNNDNSKLKNSEKLCSFDIVYDITPNINWKNLLSNCNSKENTTNISDKSHQTSKTDFNYTILTKFPELRNADILYEGNTIKSKEYNVLNVNSSINSQLRQDDESNNNYEEIGNKNQAITINNKNIYDNNTISRYFKINLNIKCNNCNEIGHIARHCPNEKIVICNKCNKEGHVSYKCPNIKCFKCNKIGHKAGECNEVIKTICSSCNFNGHKSIDCLRSSTYTVLKHKLKDLCLYKSLKNLNNKCNKKYYNVSSLSSKEYVFCLAEISDYNSDLEEISEDDNQLNNNTSKLNGTDISDLDLSDDVKDNKTNNSNKISLLKKKLKENKKEELKSKKDTDKHESNAIILCPICALMHRSGKRCYREHNQDWDNHRKNFRSNYNNYNSDNIRSYNNKHAKLNDYKIKFKHNDDNSLDSIYISDYKSKKNEHRNYYEFNKNIMKYHSNTETINDKIYEKTSKLINYTRHSKK